MTIDWTMANLRHLPGLTVSKVWSEWKPRSTSKAFVLFLALVGLACYRRTVFGLTCLSLLAGDILMVASTWSVEGRFTYPTIVALYAAAGAGAWSLLRLVTDLRNQIVID